MFEKNVIATKMDRPSERISNYIRNQIMKMFL